MKLVRLAFLSGLFVVLATALFTLLLPPTFSALDAFYSHQAKPQIDFQPIDGSTPPAKQPNMVASEFMVVSWVGIAAGLSISLTALLFFGATKLRTLRLPLALQRRPAH